jgi:hypothetical protein
MAVMDFGEIRDFIRAKVLDMDETNYGLDEPQLGREVNAAYLDYMAKVDKSVGLIHTMQTTSTFIYNVAPTAPYPRNIIRAECIDQSQSSLSGVATLERMEVPELQALIDGALAAPGVSAFVGVGPIPLFWAIRQEYGSPVSYKLYLYPEVTGSIDVRLYGERNPVALVEDSDTPAVTEPEAYWIGMIAAVRVATLLGRASQPGFIEGLIRDLPDDIVLAMGLQQQFARPRSRQGEETV